MHMADALLSPAVGGTCWAAAAGLIGWCARRVRRELDERKTPLMGVLGAFIFAAQMINFSIPGTGSSGHLGGGLILAILLGPHAAFLTIASVLIVQALVFLDGGLLALGCNIINMGFFSCFIAYPFLFQRLRGSRPSPVRLTVAAIVAATVGLELGALAVTVETALSGMAALPFRPFAAVMLPIHLAIGLVEGLVTAGLIVFLARVRPDMLETHAEAPDTTRAAAPSLKPVLAGLLLATAVVGGVLSWMASSSPDGLEWALAKVSGRKEVEAPVQGIHRTLADAQERLALMPDYVLPADAQAGAAETAEDAAGGPGLVNPETTLAGLVGGAATLALALGGGLLLTRRRALA